MPGYLKREFYYCWKLRHPGWNPQRYLAKKTPAALHLPLGVLQRLTLGLKSLAEQFSVTISQQNLSRWIDCLGSA